MVGLTFIVQMILPLDIWILRLLRDSETIWQLTPRPYQSLTTIKLLSQLVAFMAFFTAVFFILKFSQISKRLSHDKWVAILFVNGSGLYLYALLIDLSAGLRYPHQLSHAQSASLLTDTLHQITLLNSFNGFIFIIAKLLLLSAATRFLISINPKY